MRRAARTETEILRAAMGGRDAASLPFVSVVVPTYCRPVPLARCLEALARQDHPRQRFEVIVVDDGSPSPPRKLVARWQDRMNVELVVQSNAGPASARNSGAARAQGELLAFTDDDCEPRPDWLRCLVRRASEHAGRGIGIGGRTLNALPANPFSAASQMLVDYLYAYHDATGGARFFTSNNLAVPAALFREVGGFPADFPRAAGEDREFCDRWLHCGHELVYAPDAVVDHRHELDLRRFVAQHFGYGRGAFQFQQVRAARGEATLLEPFEFYRGLVTYPADRCGGATALLAMGLLAVSQLANAAGFFWQRWRSFRAATRPSLGPGSPS